MRDSMLTPHPEMNLFLWSLLMNRIEMAKVFWKIGQVKLYIQRRILHSSSYVFLENEKFLHL